MYDDCHMQHACPKDYMTIYIKISNRFKVMADNSIYIYTI